MPNGQMTREQLDELVRRIGREVLGEEFADDFAKQIRLESGNYAPDVVYGTRVSSAGAQGIAQFMPDTAESLGVNPYDVPAAVRAAAQHMKDNKRKWDSTLRHAYPGIVNSDGQELDGWDFALAAYNAGEPRAREALDAARREQQRTGRHIDWTTQLPGETQQYLGILGTISPPLNPPGIQEDEDGQTGGPLQIDSLVDSLYPGARNLPYYQNLRLAVAQAVNNGELDHLLSTDSSGKITVTNPDEARSAMGMGQLIPAAKKAKTEEEFFTALGGFKRPDGTWLFTDPSTGLPVLYDFAGMTSDAEIKRVADDLALQWAAGAQGRYEREQSRLEEETRGRGEQLDFEREKFGEELGFSREQEKAIAKRHVETLGFDYDQLKEIARHNGVTEEQFNRELAQKAQQFESTQQFEREGRLAEFDLQATETLGRQENEASKFIQDVFRQPSDVLTRMLITRGQGEPGQGLQQADLLNDLRSRLLGSRETIEQARSRLIGGGGGTQAPAAPVPTQTPVPTAAPSPAAAPPASRPDLSRTPEAAAALVPGLQEAMRQSPNDFGAALRAATGQGGGQAPPTLAQANAGVQAGQMDFGEALRSLTGQDSRLAPQPSGITPEALAAGQQRLAQTGGTAGAGDQRLGDFWRGKAPEQLSQFVTGGFEGSGLAPERVAEIAKQITDAQVAAGNLQPVGMAAGGMTTSRLLKVGEKGPEILANPTGEPLMVINNPDTMRLLGGQAKPFQAGTLDTLSSRRARRMPILGQEPSYSAPPLDQQQPGFSYLMGNPQAPQQPQTPRDVTPTRLLDQPITQDEIIGLARQSTPPAFQSLLEGGLPNRFQTPIEKTGLPTLQGVSKLTPTEVQASQPRLAAEFGITFDDLLRNIVERFGKGQRSGRSRLFVR